ncbi:MAG: sigma-70 family RNA polymerase sigma factor [Candidatus Marinimicrobia bacterium]|nr:sigma-70 family RNA polymerase sigma factor [Candidatus Neomarinimicrobiota bacterium]HJM46510.1 sigma-70 family RNA polymerase sigma factor [Candidatus Neomarinimicrobiota bacterium]
MSQLSRNSSSMQSVSQKNRYQYSDEELIASFQNGNEQAYNELVRRYRNRLMTFVFRFVGDMESSEDIVQDTMVKVFTHKHYYKEIAKFSTWIYTIAGNLAKTELRKRKRRKVTLLSQMNTDDRKYEIPSTELQSEDIVQGEYTERYIQKAILQLPLHFRTVVILRDIQELSYEEISNIVNVPLGTVKSRINRARLQLQQTLKEYR